MRAQLIGRKIAMPIAILLTLLAGSESGLAGNDLASGRDPRMGSARTFTPAQSAKIAAAGTQMAALNAGKSPSHPPACTLPMGRSRRFGRT